MDGMEWKRSKYSGHVKRFLMYAEKLAVKYSDHLVADSTAVKVYLDNKYKVESSYISYGAEITEGANEELLKPYRIVKHEYYMLMARMEPENNIDMILEGFCKTAAVERFVVVGNTNNSFGKKMLEKYAGDKRVDFVGAIFEEGSTNALRKYCKLYFHGHSVGGTNPSLLEAMASGAAIAAHDNEFNRAVLQEDSFYFKNSNDVQELINTTNRSGVTTLMTNQNLEKIKTQFNWPAIIDAYEAMIVECYHRIKQ
jgi:glycosyltransferase involved in cell wall biosynthesis